MYKCDICGRPMKKKISLYGYILCHKHMHQLYNTGTFQDNIQRTNTDLNDYRIEGDTAIFNVYNQKNIKIGEFVVDKEDANKIRYMKWRLDSNSYPVTGSGRGNIRQLSHVIYGEDNISEGYVIDHINGNVLDNRKENLRMCTQAENTKNVSMPVNNTSGFTGVYWYKGKWVVNIKKNCIHIHLFRYKTKEEAVYARYIAAKYLYGEYNNREEEEKQYLYTRSLDDNIKEEIEKKVLDKLKAKGL